MKNRQDQIGSPPKDLLGLDMTPDLIRAIPRDMVLRHRIVPIHLDKEGLLIAIADPTDSAALDEIRFFIDHDVKIILAEKDDIESLIRKHYSDAIDLNLAAVMPGPQITGSVLNYNDDVIVETVNAIISNAVRMNASDVHIEPLETRIRIRYRIDGFCYEINSFPGELKPPITARAKVMAGMDLAEKRLPQDGRIITQLDGKDVDIRVSSLPVAHGESIVFRILDKSNVRKGVKTLGLIKEDYEQVMSIASIPDGMIIISGPTGSGKTTTLYAILHELIKPEINIITIEDPVEYTLDGINQIEVRPGHGRDFGRILRHILRHDPDVIMVGEMRDLESVEIAMRSALTGHKVLSTLHTNDAPSIIARFINMGLPPFMINASVQAAIYQRLVRTLCPRCKIPSAPTKAEMLLLINRRERTGGRGQGTGDSLIGLSSLNGLNGLNGFMDRGQKTRASDTGGQCPPYTDTYTDTKKGGWGDEFLDLLSSHIPDLNHLLASIGNEVKWFRPGGCKECNFSGYKGRTALFEIMLMDDELRRLTMKKTPSMTIRRVALEHGMRDIRIDGLMKVMQGITTVSEVLRVT